MSGVPYKPEDIYELVDKIDSIIPKDDHDFKNMKGAMDYLKQSMKWTAPEALFRRWNDLYQILEAVPSNSEMEKQIQYFFKTVGLNDNEKMKC